MTIIEEYVALGEARGEARGIERVAIRLIEKGLDLSLIEQTTQLSLSKLKELQQKAKH